MDAHASPRDELGVHPIRLSVVYGVDSRSGREPIPEGQPMTTSRIQLALNVADIEAATRFYSDRFGFRPARRHSDYASFVIADPPLKLVLFENPGAATPLNHLGVEVTSTSDVVAAADRFAAAGLR